MELPKANSRSSLASQSGQAVTEYILILIAVVGIALGVIYQFNSAFKVWATNYFGEYVACLLETGELPIIDSAPGDSGVCTELFKPFSLADGRPPNPPTSGGTNPGDGSSGPSRGGRESGRGGSSGGHGGEFGGASRFGRGGGGSQVGSGKQKLGSKDSQYTGSTAAGGYGGGYSATNKKLNTGVKQRLDNKFAFEDEKEGKEKRSTAKVTRSSASQEEGSVKRAKIKRKELGKNTGEGGDVGFTIGNFLKYLIIAAIVIALVFFLGGQMLQVSKSMD